MYKITKAGTKNRGDTQNQKHREPRSSRRAVYLRDTDPDKGLAPRGSRKAAQKNWPGDPRAAAADAPTEGGSRVLGRTGSSPAARRDRPRSALDPERRSRWGEAGPCTRPNRASDLNRGSCRPGRIPEVRCWNGEGNDLVHLAEAAGTGRRNRCWEGARGNLKG